MKAQHSIIGVIVILLLMACSGRHEHMRERLQYVSDCNRADTVFTARWLPTVDSLVSYFDPSSRSWTERIFSLPFRKGAGVGSNDRMMAHYLQGRVHHDMGEAPQALECYQKAAEQADTTSSDCDLYTLYAVYGQMADLYHAQYLPNDEMQALQMAEWIARKNSDTIAAIKAYELRIRPYSLKGKKDSMLFIMKNTRNYYLQAGDTADAATAIYSAISIFLDHHNYSEVKRLLDIYEQGSGNFDKDGKVLKGEMYYYDKGRYLLAIGKTDEACQYFNKAIESGFLEAGYRGLLSVYEQQDRPDSISKYAKLFAAANDSSYLHVNQKAVHQISAMYDYSRQQQIAEQNAAKARKALWGWIIASAITIITIVSTLLQIKRIRQREERKYLQISEEFERTKEKLANALDRQRLLAYDCETAMRERQEERDNHQIDLFSAEMEKKAIEIEELREKIRLLESRLDQFSSVDMEAAFKKSRIYRRFNELKDVRHIHEHPTEGEWIELSELFRTHFVRYYAFISIDHGLPSNQYRYCILFRLGFDGNEIGIIMDKDKDQRYNLRKIIYETLFGKPINVKMLDEKLRKHF